MKNALNKRYFANRLSNCINLLKTNKLPVPVSRFVLIVERSEIFMLQIKYSFIKISSFDFTLDVAADEYLNRRNDAKNTVLTC